MVHFNVQSGRRCFGNVRLDLLEHAVRLHPGDLPKERIGGGMKTGDDNETRRIRQAFHRPGAGYRRRLVFRPFGCGILYPCQVIVPADVLDRRYIHRMSPCMIGDDSPCVLRYQLLDPGWIDVSITSQWL